MQAEPQAVDAALRLFEALKTRGVSPDVAATATASVLAIVPARLLTAEEFAAFVNRDVETVKNWARFRQVPSVRVGKTLVGFQLETVLKALVQKVR